MRVLLLTILILVAFVTIAKTQIQWNEWEYHEIIGNGETDNPKAIRVYLDETGFDLRVLGNYAPTKDVQNVLQGAKTFTTVLKGASLRITPRLGITIEQAYNETKDLILERYGFKRLTSNLN